MFQQFRNLPIKSKLFIEIVLLILLIASFLVFYFPHHQKQIAISGLQNKAISLAEMMAYSSSAGVEFEDVVSVKDAFAGVEGDPDLRYAKVLKSDGSHFASHGPKADTGPSPDEVRAQGSRHEGDISILQRDGMLNTLAPIHSSGGNPIGNVQIGLSLNRIQKEVRKNRWLTLGISFGILFLGLLFAFFIGNSVASPIRLLQTAVESVASGDFGTHITIQSQDEIGQLGQSFQTMTEKIRDLIMSVQEKTEISEKARIDAEAEKSRVEELVTQIQEAGLQLSSATNEIVAASKQQASGAAEQLAAVNQTIATVEELAATSGQIAESADHVAQLAEQSLQDAHAGQTAINDVIEAMDAILKASHQSAKRISVLNEKSQAIEEVLDIITNIARKTDLLSLNAAIEAVNAGDAGKGFGVVASETRRLAEDVIESTKEIKALTQEIQNSISASVMATDEGARQVDQGALLVKKTEQSLNEILEMVQQTAESAKAISISTQQQRTAGEQMVAAMQEIGEVSHQAAAGAKQTVNAANDLTQLGENLEELIISR